MAHEDDLSGGTGPAARSGRTWKGVGAWNLEAKTELCIFCPDAVIRKKEVR